MSICTGICICITDAFAVGTASESVCVDWHPGHSSVVFLTLSTTKTKYEILQNVLSCVNVRKLIRGIYGEVRKILR